MSTKDLIAPFIQLLALSMPISAQKFLCGTFIPIFMLHRMECPDLNLEGHNPQKLEKILKLLRRHKFNFISLEEAANHLSNQTEPPPRSIAFTMDDGFWDHHMIAAPIFDRYDCPATFFLITDFINKNLWPWDDQVAYIIKNCEKGMINLPNSNSSIHLGDNKNSRKRAFQLIIEQFKTSTNSNLYEKLSQLYIAAGVASPSGIPEKHQPMSWENSRALIRRGHTVGAHTKSHRILSRLNDQESHEEIIGSITEVNKQTGRSSIFAYPTGRPQDFSKREIDLLQTTCVNSAVTTTPLSATSIKNCRDIYQLPRFALPDNKLDLIQYATWVEVFKNGIRSN